MTKQIAIVDDEKDARQVLRTLLEWCPDVKVVGEADGVNSGYQLLAQLQPTAVFLDISMQDGTGFDLLDKFPKPPCQIVFVTAHDEFALRAFRYNALDYLVKPIDPKELLRTVERINNGFRIEDLSQQVASLLKNMQERRLERIALNTQKGLLFLRTERIIYLQSDGSYTTFFTLNNERHMVSRSIKEYENLLADAGFFRIHQSYMVNLSYVKGVMREDGGYAEMENGAKLPVARRRKDEFLKLLGE